MSDLFSLAGKKALVTGGAQGIGQQIVDSAVLSAREKRTVALLG